MKASLALLLLLTLVSSSAPAAEKDIYNPLAVGLRWEADIVITGPDGKANQAKGAREITGVETIAGKEYFKCVTKFVGIPGVSEFITYRRKTDDGIYAINGFEPGNREYLETGLPLVPGKTWTSAATTKETADYKVGRPETVTVAGKKYEKCIKVTYLSKETARTGHFFLAPEVGNVMETFKLGGVIFQFKLTAFRGAK